MYTNYGIHRILVVVCIIISTACAPTATPAPAQPRQPLPAAERPIPSSTGVVQKQAPDTLLPQPSPSTARPISSPTAVPTHPASPTSASSSIDQAPTPFPTPILFPPIYINPIFPIFSWPSPVNAPQWQGGWTNIQPAHAVQQSFLPNSPFLRTIEVDIAPGSGSGGDMLILEVLDKNGATLFTQSKDVQPGFDGWLRFDVSSGGIQVVPGEILYLRLQDTGKIAFGWKYSSDTYPGGYAIFNGTPAMDMDFYFRVNQ